MADHVEEKNDQMDMLQYLPADDSMDRIDTLWRQIMVFKAFSDGNVAGSRARREHAEAAREQAEKEAAEATRLLCEGMKAEADRQLVEANELRAKAERLQEKVKSERDRVEKLAREAQAEGDRIVAEAKQRAQEILDEARKAARREGTALRHQALKEIREILARVESVREATNEELETQRIFSNIARLKSTAPSLPTQPASPDDAGPASIPAGDAAEASLDGAQTQKPADDASERAPVMTASTSSNGKSSAAADDKQSGPASKGARRKDKGGSKT